jgi:hypothetical protein
VAEADAAIVVYRSEPFAGEDETSFAEEVTRKAGKVFTVINLRSSHTMPPSQTLINVARQRLGLDPNRSLDDQDVYFAHFLDGEKAAFRGDGALSQASGLATIQVRLARFLISERLGAHVLKSIRTVHPLATTVDRTLEEFSITVRAEAGALQVVLEQAEKDIERLKRKKDAIDVMLRLAEQSVQASVLSSFENLVARTADSLPAKIAGAKIPDLDRFWSRLGAGSINNRKWVEKATSLIQDEVRRQFDDWATAEPDKPGLARDISPAVEQMTASLKEQAEDIADIINNMHRRIKALDPSLRSEAGIVSLGSMIAAGSIATLIFGPLGPVIGTGGWRGLAGSVAGTLVAGFGLQAVIGIIGIAFPPWWVPIIVVAISGTLGAAFGSITALEKRLKDASWRELEPKIRGLAADAAARATLKGEIEKWFVKARADMINSIAKFVAAEEEGIRRLADLSRSREDKTKLLADVQTYRQAVATARARVKAAEAEFDPTAARR